MSNKTPIAFAVCGLATMVFLIGTLGVHASEGIRELSPEDVPSIAEESNFIPHQQQDANMPLLSPAKSTDSSGPVLKDVRTTEQGGQTLLIKTWDVLPDYDAELLVEADFEKGGLHYKKAYLLQVSENHDNQKKLASETVKVAHTKKDDAISKLQPILDYSLDGFAGQLTLQTDSIVTEVTDKNSYSYTVTDVQEYSGLSRNDPYDIPKIVNKNGTHLQLIDVKWTEMGEGNYKATASYSGSATGTSATGYLSTATYIGEVTKETLDSVTYAVVYEGSVIPPPPFDFSPYLVVGTGILIALITVMVLLNKRDNTKVYAMIGKEYQLVHKQKLTALAPIIDLSPQEISGQSDEFMIILDRLAIRKMRGQSIKIIGKDGMMKEHRVYKIRHFHIGQNFEEEYGI